MPVAVDIIPPTEAPKQLSTERSHPDLIHLHTSGESFKNYITSLVDLPRGSIFTRLDPKQLTSSPKATYQTVQCGRNSHILLNSDLVLVNHSCDPSLVFDMSKLEVRVVDDRDLRKGDLLSFFYPSSEWDSAQPFTCECGVEEKCLGVMQGAKYLDTAVLQRYWLNEHIRDLIKERDGAEK